MRCSRTARSTTPTRWSTQWIGGYDRAGILHGHIRWHQALGALETGDAAKALSIYADVLQPSVNAAPPLNVMSDCASLLWRLEAYGHAVPEQLWEDADAYARKYFPKMSLPFVEMHMALFAAATGNQSALEERLRVIEQRLAEGKLPAGPVVPQNLPGAERVRGRGLCGLRCASRTRARRGRAHRRQPCAARDHRGYLYRRA